MREVHFSVGKMEKYNSFVCWSKDEGYERFFKEQSEIILLVTVKRRLKTGL